MPRTLDTPEWVPETKDEREFIIKNRELFYKFVNLMVMLIVFGWVLTTFIVNFF